MGSIPRFCLFTLFAQDVPLLQTADVIILCDRNNVTQLRGIQVVSRNLHNRLAPQGTVSVCNRKRTTLLLKNKTKSQPVGKMLLHPYHGSKPVLWSRAANRGRARLDPTCWTGECGCRWHPVWRNRPLSVPET